MTAGVSNKATQDPLQSGYPHNACIYHLFEEQVRLTPSAIAVQMGEERLTYAELNLAAESVAHTLRQIGVGEDTLVGICLPRSFSLIVGLLGILKAGGAYVALNELNPRPHLASIIDDTKMAVLLTHKYLLSLLPFESGFAVCLDSNGAVTATIDCGGARSADEEPRQSRQGRVNHPSALSLAYVSFTSGSTGPPKGVCITHRGVVRLVRNTNYARLTPDEVFLQWSPIAFDASTFEVWAPLLNGARLVLFPPEPFSHAILRDLIRSQGISTLWLTAGVFHQIVERDVEVLQGIRQLLVGGDVLAVGLVQTAAERLDGCQIINGYGPTENTTFTCCYPVRLPLPTTASVPIGRPISNTSVYVLDSDGKQVAVGEPGELAIAGDGLARGYLNLPELTSQRFISKRFGDGPPLRLYLSGDWVRYLPDGNLEFLGRMDRQIKLRGFRVELPAIEKALASHDCVYEAAVLTQGSATHKRLEAYIVPKSGAVLTNQALREFLSSQLPDYMLPHDFFYLSEMPLTPSGKMDHQALAKLGEALPVEGDREMSFARTRTEKVLAQLWGEALGRQEVDIDEKFLDAGGDSLQAVGLVLSIERKLNKRVSVAAIGRETVRTLANLLDRLPVCESNVNDGVLLMNNGATGGDRAPLFFVPGQAGDDLHCYLHVIADLPKKQQVYGLQVHEYGFETIEETAAYYIQQLHQSQPSGPYFLCGFCFGGLVAFEMAQQLQALGERVELLAVIDYRVNTDELVVFPRRPSDIFRFARNCSYALADFFEIPEERKSSLQRLFAKLATYCKRVWRRNNLPLLNDTDEVPSTDWGQTGFSTDQLARRLKIEHRAWRRYQPRPYTGPVSLFRPRRLPLLTPYDETLGWSRIATSALDVQKISVPGFQGWMLRPPYASILAKTLSRSLELAQKTSSFF